MIPYGVHRDMPAEVYHKLPCISASLLKKFHGVTDAHAKVAIDTPFVETPETMLGTLAHHAILEPDNPWPKLAIQPDVYTNEKGETKPWHNGAKACKDWIAKQEGAGLRVMLEREVQRLNRMVDAVRSHAGAMELLKDGQAEVSFVIPDCEQSFGHPLKARMDWIPKRGPLVDLKFFRDVSDFGFKKDASMRGLHIQAALYQVIYNALHPNDRRDEFHFIAVENEPPHCVRIFIASQEFIKRGWEDAKTYMKRYARAIESGVWAGYGNDPVWLDYWEQKGKQ